MTAIPCTRCGGQGQTETSKWGGNDPNTWLVRCEHCDGSGLEPCCEWSLSHPGKRLACDSPATDAFIEPGRVDNPERAFFLCAEHMALYVQAAAD